MSFDISESSDKKQSEKNLREMLLHQEYRECVTHRPTLLIGLGGTGVKSLYRFRHMMIKEHGSPSPTSNPIEYAYVDLNRDHDESGYLVCLAMSDTAVALSKDDCINISDFDLNALIDNPPDHIREWLEVDKTSMIKVIDPSKGAGQIRPLSKLALYANYDTVRSAMESKLNRLQTYGVNNTSGKPQVIVIAGMAGGTGSGLFLDILAMIRSLQPTLI